MSARLVRFGGAALLFASACVVRSDLPKETFRIQVDLTLADGSPLPTEDQSLCLDLRGDNPKCPAGQVFKIDLTAINESGVTDTTFNGYARITTRPGTVVDVTGDRANGRNVLLKNGVAQGQLVHLVGTYGPTRIEAEDEGYNPTNPTTDATPACANGKDDDGDGLIDYPADPGCAAPNDDTEQAGSAAAGVSPVIWYQYPDIPAVQGLGPATPFESEQVVTETRPERGAYLVVTRVSSGGMFVSDLQVDPATQLPITKAGTAGTVTTVPKDFGGLYIFNFSVPAGVRVCDRISYLAGTMSEFHGWTEMGFPSYGVVPWYPEGMPGSPGPCQVPEPILLTGTGGMYSVTNPSNVLEKVESGLVRVVGARIGSKFGPKVAVPKLDMNGNPVMLDAGNACALTASTQTTPTLTQYAFDVDQSACDFDHSGGTNFDTDIEESNCICWCFQDPDCSLYDNYEQRGNFRVNVLPNMGGDPNQTILINTDTVATFDPRAYRGQIIPSFTGTLSNFSGGDLNWTVEARCSDDVVACAVGDDACQANPPAPMAAGAACVKPRIQDDNEANTN